MTHEGFLVLAASVFEVQDIKMSGMCSSVAGSFPCLSVSLQLQVGGTSSVKRSLNVPWMSITDCIDVWCWRQTLKTELTVCLCVTINVLHKLGQIGINLNSSETKYCHRSRTVKTMFNSVDFITCLKAMQISCVHLYSLWLCVLWMMR